VRGRGCILIFLLEFFINQINMFLVLLICMNTHSLFCCDKVLTYTSNPDNYESIGVQCDEESAVFCLELLIRVVLQNR
jgi:hypothetical protein